MSPEQYKILEVLERVTRDMPSPMVTSLIEVFGRDPFIVLISCLLSLRTRDIITYPVCLKLFSLIQSPQELLCIPVQDLERLFHSLGFYRKKARLMHHVSQELIDRFNGLVPHTHEELLSIKGIGPKTAALVLAEGFGIPAICVDTHVHRLSNRIGFVNTKTPRQTEDALKQLVPQDWWTRINRLFVTWGQNICTPVAPFCKTKCAIKELCPKIGVTRMR